MCLDEKAITIGELPVHQGEDLGILQGLIRERKDGGLLKSKSI